MRILEFTTGLAGAACAHLLTLQGADVLRIIPAGPPRGGSPPHDPFVADLLDRGKTRIPLDLTSQSDRTRFLDLLTETDVLVDDLGPEGFAPFGLDEAALLMRRPSLVRTRISEFGIDGPWAAWHGSELINLAAGGLLFLTGPCDRPPVQLAPYQAQLTAALLAAIATSAALLSGGPVAIDISKQEAILGMISPSLTNYAYTGVVDAREGSVAGMTRIEHAADTWVYAGPSNPTSADYTRFAEFLGIPALAELRFATPDARMAHWDEHQALILPRLRERTAKEWVDAAEQWRMTFGYVQTTTDLLACPVLNERSFFGDVPTTAGAARAPLSPYLVNGERPAVRTPHRGESTPAS